MGSSDPPGAGSPAHGIEDSSSEIADAIAADLPAEAKAQYEIRELLLLHALLAVSRGTRVSKRYVHDAWVTWQLLRGQAHDSNVPFDELADDVQAADEP